MSTSERAIIETGRRRRRKHSAVFKAEAVGACQQPGVSVAAVALARGLNANMLRNWVKRAERGKAPIAIRPTLPSVESSMPERFLPVEIPRSTVSEAIRVEVHRNGRRISIEWPASAARECAVLLKELMK